MWGWKFLNSLTLFRYTYNVNLQHSLIGKIVTWVNFCCQVRFTFEIHARTHTVSSKWSSGSIVDFYLRSKQQDSFQKWSESSLISDNNKFQLFCARSNFFFSSLKASLHQGKRQSQEDRCPHHDLSVWPSSGTLTNPTRSSPTWCPIGASTSTTTLLTWACSNLVSLKLLTKSSFPFPNQRKSASMTYIFFMWTDARNNTAITCCEDGQRIVPPPHPACMPIDLPENDPFYSKFRQTCMEFVRSTPAFDCRLGYIDQVNHHKFFKRIDKWYLETDFIEKIATNRCSLKDNLPGEPLTISFEL